MAAVSVRMLVNDGALFAGVAALQQAAGHEEGRTYVVAGDVIQVEAEVCACCPACPRLSVSLSLSHVSVLDSKHIQQNLNPPT